MAKNKKTIKSIKNIGEEIKQADGVFHRILQLVRPSDHSDRDREIELLSNKIDEVIDTSFSDMTHTSEDNYDTFYNNVAKRSAYLSTAGSRTMGDIGSLEDLFESQGGGIIDAIRKEHTNQFIKYDDLHIITENINEIMLAVTIMRDAILQGDNPLDSVSRSIDIIGSSKDDKSEQLIRAINQMEEETEIQTKLYDHVILNTLIYGKYYVYTTPYSEIYAHHVRRMRRLSGLSASAKNVTESMLDDWSNEIDKLEGEKEIILESATVDALIKESENLENPTMKDKEKYAEAVNEFTKGLKINNNYVPLPFIEDGWEGVGSMVEEGVFESKENIEHLMDGDGKSRRNFLRSIAGRGREMKHPQSKKQGDKPPTFNGGSFYDGVYNLASDKSEDYSSVEGVYIRLIKPQNIIPIKIMNQCIGYYYIHTEPRTTNMSRTPMGRTFTMDLEDIGLQGEQNDIISLLSSEIVRQLDKDFIEKNAKFKELITNSLIHNNIHNLGLTYQFIPAEYITEFSINHDTEGEGQSVIEPSLVKAKLYLILTYFNVLVTLNLSSDQRMMYINSSGTDQNMANRIQRIARSHKRLEVTATDLVSNFRSLFSKAGAGRTVYSPVGPDGQRSIDYEILEGQDIKIDIEFMEMLKNDAINSTSVPSVMIDHSRDVDYSRRLEMANTMFLTRTASYKKTISKPITDMYRKLLIYGNYVDPSDLLQFNISLSPTQYLNSSLFSDILSNAESASSVLSEIFMGTNQEHSELDNITQDIMRSKILKEMASSIDLDKYERMYSDARIEAVKVSGDKRQSNLNAEKAEKSQEDLSEGDPTNSWNF